MSGLSSFVSSLHLLALGVGLGAVFMRGVYLRAELDEAGLRRVHMADNLWGVAAMLWIGSGLWRAFGGLEKGTAFYLANPMFHLKMGLFLLTLLLELWPMITFLRQRFDLAKGRPIRPFNAPALRRINDLEVVVVVSMVFVASAMARGLGMGAG